MHRRTEIKNKFKELLIGRTSLFLNSVRISRRRSISENCISIYSDSESSEIYTYSPKQYKRNAKITVEAFVIAEEFEGEDFDHLVDQASEEIENAINYDYNLGGIAESVILSDTDIETNTESSKIITAIKLTYSVEYISMESLTIEQLNQIDSNNVTNLDSIKGDMSSEDLSIEVLTNHNA